MGALTKKRRQYPSAYGGSTPESRRQTADEITGWYQKLKRLWKMGKMPATGFGNVLNDVIGDIDSL